MTQVNFRIDEHVKDEAEDVRVPRNGRGRTVLYCYAEQDAECRPSARQMMCSALADATFNWAEAERLADTCDFKVLPQLRALREELAHA